MDGWYWLIDGWLCKAKGVGKFDFWFMGVRQNHLEVCYNGEVVFRTLMKPVTFCWMNYFAQVCKDACRLGQWLKYCVVENKVPGFILATQFTFPLLPTCELKMHLWLQCDLFTSSSSSFIKVTNNCFCGRYCQLKQVWPDFARNLYYLLGRQIWKDG